MLHVARVQLLGLVCVEAKPTLYWPSLLNHSDMKWLAHTHKLTGSIAGMLLLKMKRNHCLFCCSVTGTQYRNLCWFLKSTTDQYECLTLSENIAKHCYLTAGHTELHLGDGRPHLRYLLSRAEEACLCKWLLSLQNERRWIWTACRSDVLPVDGLQRPCRNRSWQVQGGPVYTCRDQRKRVFHNMGLLNNLKYFI